MEMRAQPLWRPTCTEVAMPLPLGRTVPSQGFQSPCRSMHQELTLWALKAWYSPRVPR